jgi:hypothetical protein
MAVSAPEDEMLSAPAPWPMPTVNPFSIIEAARDAAKKAGFVDYSTTPLPKVYWPVVYYRAPGDFLFTTGPPLQDGPEPPIPSPALLQTGQAHSATSALRRLRQRAVSR